MLLDVFSDDVDWAVCVESVKLSRLLVEVHHGLGLFIEHLQPLGDGLFVVVRPATGLPSFEQPPLELLLRALKVNHRLEIDPLGHLLLPNIHVLLAPRESVKEIPAAEIVALDLFADQFDHEATRNELSFFHDGAELLPERRASLNLLTKQVSCRQMDKVVLSHQHVALAKLSKVVRSFARARAAEHEEKLGWIGRQDVRCSQFILQLGVNVLAAFGSINSNAVLLLLKAFHDGLCLSLEGLYSFLHSLRIIVRPPAGLAALSHAVD